MVKLVVVRCGKSSFSNRQQHDCFFSVMVPFVAELYGVWSLRIFLLLTISLDDASMKTTTCNAPAYYSGRITE